MRKENTKRREREKKGKRKYFMCFGRRKEKNRRKQMIFLLWFSKRMKREITIFILYP